jgi:hypothetical protein
LLSWHHLSELFESSIEPGTDRTSGAAERLSDLVVVEAHVEPQDDHCPLVERERIQKVSDGLGIPGTSVLDNEPGRECSAPLPRPCGVATTVEDRTIQVRARVIEFVPPAKHLNERVVDEIAPFFGGPSHQRSAANLAC